MTPFTTLTSVAAPLPEANVDTDIIFPARYLLLTQKAGLGPYAFRERRFDAQDQPRADFVLHQPRWQGAQILVAGANFGCGSSREQAPWALADLGLRCLIAPSFGEIFEANCLNNGLLPISLPAAEHARVMAVAQAGGVLTVSLVDQTLSLPDGGVLALRIGARQRQALLQGWDEIDRICHEQADAIAAFESRQRLTQPWLYANELSSGG